MAKVIAKEKGYYGNAIREAGDVFEAKGVASWFEPVKVKAKEIETVDPVVDGDNDDQGDGDQDDGHSHGDGLQAMTVKALRAHAKTHGIAIPAEANTKADIIAVIEAGEKANAPVRASNEIIEQTGSMQPDWVQS